MLLCFDEIFQVEFFVLLHALNETCIKETLPYALQAVNVIQDT